MRFPQAKIAAITTLIALGSMLSLLAARSAQADNQIFPPAPAARDAVNFDGKGFLINGKRTFLASAGVEYARIPHELWRDRLVQLKRAGFNCIEIYTFWNWHEPQEGKFDFTGDHDLGAFLKLIHELGMYSIVRVGPYSCAEWDSGGFPIWLRFKPGVRVREDNAPFKEAMDHFFDKLIPIVAANQIHKGGSVVLVQLENEHPQFFYKDDESNGYHRHLREKALALGVEVPYFFSGLHHGSDPASDNAMDDPKRNYPWFSTEFWSVWFDRYGSGAKEAADYDRRTWKIIAHGGNGYNYYMAHGGSNFAYTNDHEDAASYDYGAAIGQAGDLRPLYYTFKRAALFSRSFQEILENGSDATNEYKGAASQAGIKVTARRGPAGTIVFLDNPGKSPLQTQVTVPGIPATGSLTVAPGELMPIIRDFAVTPGVTLQWAPTRIFSIVPQGDTTTLVVYGPSGSPAELRFQVKDKATVTSGGKAWTATADSVTLQTTIPKTDPAEYAFTVGAKRIRVIAVSDALAAHTWVVDAGNTHYVVTGPASVTEVSVEKGKLRLTTEQPWEATTTYQTMVFGPTGSAVRLQGKQATATHPKTLPLTAWQVKDATAPSQPDFADTNWYATESPLQMGADGDNTANAWYRTKFSVPSAQEYTIQLGSVGGRMTAYMDGKPIPAASAKGNRFALSLATGAHALSVFTAHDGRDKMFNYLGPIDIMDAKGLRGPVTASIGTTIPVDDWSVRKLTEAPGEDAVPPAVDAGGWMPYTFGADPFGGKHGFAWFIATLPTDATGNTVRSLYFPSVDDTATVFINGKKVLQHEGWNDPFEIPLGADWNTDGPNTVAVLVENNDNVGGISEPVSFTTYQYRQTITGWKMQGGPGDPNDKSGWEALSSTSKVNGPQWYHTTFTTNPPAATGSHPIWRVIPTGLGHGSVWVNGHNLGRYPERIPAPGLYIPECWLVPGENHLVIYDEDGTLPTSVTIQAEVAASRDIDIVE